MSDTQQATFGAGCFWGAEAYFREIEGVIDTRVGHATGTDGSTRPGRIEVVQVEFDPSVVSYAKLIDLFWLGHDPLSFDRQGEESGEGVRSAIFFHTTEQEEAAKSLRAAFNSTSPSPATTQIIQYEGLELADDKHQRYVEKNGHQACSVPSPASSTAS
ncbi:peptide-methionine (S)-S-oxide reductase MsrA [Rhizobium grahamii]|uniref:Peptide methionine sulfoxide reductase MsrA n=2 Tax=Rhizobium grahamii TaxID=1120045 RepID=S3HE54_9HYPH|nr:peptide-methionine (S)-S-oxide reductase MsrA [Rhizobium grahamii]EPE96340.1 protein-methionine-S-oxide reductase [Rhizobium grahamii CCGE 502]RDJ02922.1 peptide-methionine (S)-S-oxide reductase [Rhizobium grahamii]